MKHRIFFTVVLALIAFVAQAQENVSGVAVSNVSLGHSDQYMSVSMDIDLSSLKVRKNQAVLLTPCLVNGSDSVSLKSIGIYGRRRYYQYLRKNGDAMLSGTDEMTYKARKKPAHIAYSDNTSYAEWMRRGNVMIARTLYGCCEEILAQEEALLRQYAPFVPTYVYVTPPAEVKTRAIEGSAYIDFPVNKTEIDPNYRKNPVELAKINATIDSVRSDKDVTIDNVWLKGYASPEGSYAHNRELSIGRVNALRDYVQQLYSFDSHVITTAYEPEDWAGLRTYVEQSALDHKADILALIDGSLEPDAKEAEIKRQYPTEYKYLLDNCYPALRHTDYRVSYTVRTYSTIDEIRAIYSTQPSNLSLNELYLLANSYEQGSDEYNDIFLTAVRLYPTDEVANINAANSALRQGDLAAAQRYVDRAGDSGAADFARGILAAVQEDYDSAVTYLSSAQSKGVTEAEQHLNFIKEQTL